MFPRYRRSLRLYHGLFTPSKSYSSKHQPAHSSRLFGGTSPPSYSHSGPLSPPPGPPPQPPAKPNNHPTPPPPLPVGRAPAGVEADRGVRVPRLVALRLNDG